MESGESGFTKILNEIIKKLDNYLNLKKQKNLIKLKNDEYECHLHATILNAKYNKPADESSSDDSDIQSRVGNSKRDKKQHSFNGVRFMREFKDYWFGCVPVSELRLCSLIGEDESRNSFYRTEIAIPL